MAEGRPHGDRRRRRADCDLEHRQGRARRGAGRPYGADRGACRLARWHDARFGVLGSHRSAVAARGRRAARARGAYAERQRRGVHRRRPRRGQRQLRPERPHLAAVRLATADRRCDADAAQQRRCRPRRRNRGRRRRRQGVLPRRERRAGRRGSGRAAAGDLDCDLARWRAGRRRKHRRRGGG